MKIGENLKFRRKKAGFTQEQVAEKMNITRQTLSHWEVGKYSPDIDSIIKLSRIYHLSLDELLLGKIHFKGDALMTKKIAFGEIQSLIKKHYRDAFNIRELNGGLVSQTYYFESGEGQYTFQAGGHLESYKKERFINGILNGILPVRRVLDVQEREDGPAYCISEYIAGDKLFDLNSQQLLDIVPAVLNILKSLESIEVNEAREGYGYFDSTGNAPFPTWKDFLGAVYNSAAYNWDSLESKGLDSEVVQNAIKELKKHMESIRFNKKHMIHGDLGSFNLLAKENRITGIIDWSLAMYGDPLYDKANFLFWNEDKLQPLIREITHTYMGTCESREIMYCYMLRIGLEEIYNTVIRSEAGYDIEWAANRLNEIMNRFQEKL
ncbi:phosphotransferase [Peribacillus sp. SCS-26]|uniref:phosphotransferase n=1 Tax=Paraperibacillus marinus TaxID=3115295 RepID=UPI003906A04D